MELKIKPFNELTPHELYGLMRARAEVFFLEQQITVEDADGVDPACTHLWIEQEGEVIALLRMIPAEVGAGCVPSIGRVLVRKAWRRQGLCRRMMTAAIDYICAAWHGTTIHLSAQLYLVDFYRELGFRTTSAVYEEAGIAHQAMELSIINKMG